MNKKGVLGITTTKTIILALLVLAVLSTAAILTVVTTRDIFEASETKFGGTIHNETLTSVTETGKTYSKNITSVRNAVCTLVRVNNATDGVTVVSANYTVNTSNGGCKIHSKVGGTCNNTNWNITYSYLGNSPEPNEMTANLTGGFNNFFKQVPVFFTLLAVVVLILIIAIVIVAVSRFSEGGEGSGAGGGISMGGGSNKGYVEEL